MRISSSKQVAEKHASLACVAQKGPHSCGPTNVHLNLHTVIKKHAAALNASTPLTQIHVL